MLKTERKTQIVMGIIVLLLAIFYIVSSLKLQDWSPYIASVVGFLIATIIIIEAGVISYWKQSKYKSLSIGDVIVWISMLVSGAVITNSLILLPQLGQIIQSRLPELVNFMGNIGASVGGIAGLMAIVYIFVPTPKA